MNRNKEPFSFLRIEKEDIHNLKRYKSVSNTKLRTGDYTIVFFYKPITKLVEID